MYKIPALIAGILALSILLGSLCLLLKKGSYDDFRKRMIFKSICSLMFWLFGWIVVWYSGTGFLSYIWFMLLGFTFSVAGDVLLAFTNEKTFIFGLISFALAHISYSAAFVIKNGFSLITAVLFVLIALAVIIITNFTGFFSLGKMRLPANLYILIISLMLGNAIYGLITGIDFISALVTAFGALLFFISDFTLAYEKFSSKGKLRLEIPVLITYYGAQICLALGMAGHIF